MKNDDMIVEVGKRILKLRQKLNISQSELAQKSDISKTYLGEIERGKRTNISLAVIARIAASLGVTMAELFDNIEVSNVSWEDDDTFADALYQNKIEDACYPPGLEGFPVTTLMQFLVYLPLLQPQHIVDSLLRIDGCFKGYEDYVLKQINFCISKIPASSEKEYADYSSRCLSRVDLKNKLNNESDLELNRCRDAYTERIKQIDSFFKGYQIMMGNSIWLNKSQ